MKFTPFSFVGSVATKGNLVGGITGSYTSGGINYTFNKITASTDLIVPSSLDVDIMIVGGGAAGDRTGGGGGGVYYNSLRLYKGTYRVTVGGESTGNGNSSSVANAGFRYEALGGTTTGTSGAPTSFAAGDNTSCGGSDLPGGGGGSAAANGLSASCVNNNYGGDGGQGLTYALDNVAAVYGSGGGGRGRATPGSFADGGTGGTNAGNGGSFPAAATNATNGYGGGGGGGYSGVVGKGGSGVVIIRYISI